ncbi:MAG: Xaa-Pro peptidase family protein [Rikenellaceae bacterium]
MIFIKNNKEQSLRWRNIAKEVSALGADAILVSSLSNNFYTAGRVFMGYSLILKNGEAYFFVRRPIDAEGEGVVVIRKPYDIMSFLSSQGIKIATLLFEGDTMSLSDYNRLIPIFEGVKFVNGSSVLRSVRSVKTTYEVDLIRSSAAIHTKTYNQIPKLFKKGMSDRDLSLLIEGEMRKNGSIGISRIAGDSMEIHVCTVLVGDNADSLSPYDFATTGAGVDESFPVGYNDTIIKEGMSVMVDGCANSNGYLSDMTRVFAVGEISALAQKAYDVSIEIYHTMVSMIKEGTPCSDIYNKAYEMASAAGLSDYFMGHAQQAGFVGHGVGIELNEAPVLAPRSKDIIKIGMVLALEPKFVIPGVGVLGVENTVSVTDKGVENLTTCTDKLINLYS